jgi:hypothetical protein
MPANIQTLWGSSVPCAYIAESYGTGLSVRMQGGLEGEYTHRGNLEVMEVRSIQNGIRKWLDLIKPLPTCITQLASLGKCSGIIRIP